MQNGKENKKGDSAMDQHITKQSKERHLMRLGQHGAMYKFKKTRAMTQHTNNLTL